MCYGQQLPSKGDTLVEGGRANDGKGGEARVARELRELIDGPAHAVPASLELRDLEDLKALADGLRL